MKTRVSTVKKAAMAGLLFALAYVGLEFSHGLPQRIALGGDANSINVFHFPVICVAAGIMFWGVFFATETISQGKMRERTVSFSVSVLLVVLMALYWLLPMVGGLYDGRTKSKSTFDAANENALNGAVVGFVGRGRDGDGTTKTYIYSLQDNDGGRFQIDASTGIASVTRGIDREADGPTRNIIVRATSADETFTYKAFTISINDVDEFDVGAVSDANATANVVNENAAVGTVVGITASASDPDATTNTITYSLQGNDGGRFQIDANTGIVTVGGAIGREAAGTTRDLTIRATSADGSFADQLFTCSIAPSSGI